MAANISVGFTVGMLFAAMIVSSGFSDLGISITKVTQLKTECEANLPRDQECHMIFVPNQK